MSDSTINVSRTVKQACVMVSPELLAEMVTTGWTIPHDGRVEIKCTQGVPAGARYVRGFYDSARDEFGMIFEHESFEETTAGQALPIIHVLLQETHRESHA